MPNQNNSSKLKLVILLSGQGTNCQAIIDAISSNRCPAEVSAVISDNPAAYGLVRAQTAHIPTHVLDYKDYASRTQHDSAMIEVIETYSPELIVLAGYLRILSDPFVHQYLGRLLNIHPSLLPKYPGLHTYEKALAASDTHHGTTIHFVTEQLDSGPIIAQAKIPILPNDTPETLAARTLPYEHQMYPTVITWFANGRLRMQQQGEPAAVLDGQIIPKAGPYPVAD